MNYFVRILKFLSINTEKNIPGFDLVYITEIFMPYVILALASTLAP